MLETVSWFGVLFLLLETGLEVDVSAAWRQRGPALRIGIIGVIIPLILGFLLSYLLPDRYLADPDQRLIFALFLGTTMAISAMVIIARVLHDLDLVKSDLGLVTLCGYAVNDILAWVVFSLVLAMGTQAILHLSTVGFLLTLYPGPLPSCVSPWVCGWWIASSPTSACNCPDTPVQFSALSAAWGCCAEQ